MFRLEHKQNVVLHNTLLACAGAFLLTVVLLFASSQGHTRISIVQIWLFLSVFWVGCFSFVFAIVLGLNNKFTDPSMSLIQMYWALVNSFIFLAFLDELHHLVYLIIVCIVTFGAFQLTRAQYLIYCIVTLLAFALFQFAHPTNTSVLIPEKILNIVVFSFCVITTTLLFSQVSTLRSRLREKNTNLQLALSAKDMFMAHMSHEIRTPLSGIVGMIEILKDTELNARQRRFIELGQTCSKNLLSILNDVLDLSKISSGRLKIERTTFNLTEEFEDIIRVYANLADEKGIELIADIRENTPSFIYGDPKRLNQILGNLLSNAVKFTNAGRVTVTVASATSANGVGQLQVSVEDTGIGISDEAREHLFDAFYQADSSTTRVYGGTGLGLAICKQLCDLLGGDIHAESTVGVGSRFRFTVPFELASGPEGSGERKEDLEASSQIEKAAVSIGQESDDIDESESSTELRILLVDDNDANKKINTEILEKLGFSVLSASNGAEAIDRIKEAEQNQPFDIVFMDCEMPVMDGYEATKRIRLGDAGKNNKNIPIIALTANALKGHKEECLAAGMDDQLSKPYGVDELLSIIDIWTSVKK